MINKKETQTGRAGPTCSRCHTPTPFPVQMGTSSVPEAKGPSEEGRGGFCPKFPRAAPLRSWSAWLSHGRRRYCSHGRQRAQDKDPDTQSRLPPPKAVPLLPLPPRSVEGRCAGKRVADSLSFMMGVPISLAGLWEGPPHTPTDHGAACD